MPSSSAPELKRAVGRCPAACDLLHVAPACSGRDRAATAHRRRDHRPDLRLRSAPGRKRASEGEEYRRPGATARSTAHPRGRGLVYDFFHDQLRALVYAEISAVRQRLLHRHVACAPGRRGVGQDEKARRPRSSPTMRAAAGRVAESGRPICAADDAPRLRQRRGHSSSAAR
ncbi:MAG: hypothetical protein R2854_28605 [Caldilineaceae bacterium]